MAIAIRHECEAVCERIEIGIADRVEDRADRQACGHALDSWRGCKVLAFHLTRNPPG